VKGFSAALLDQLQKAIQFEGAFRLQLNSVKPVKNKIRVLLAAKVDCVANENSYYILLTLNTYFTYFTL